MRPSHFVMTHWHIKTKTNMLRVLARDVYIFPYLARYQKLQQKLPLLFALEILLTDRHAKVTRGLSTYIYPYVS